MDLYSRPELFDFHGVSMTHYFTDNWENIQKFQARPDDILIASYPKAGLSINMNSMCNWSLTGVYMEVSCLDHVNLFYSVCLLGHTWLSYILDLLYFGQTSPERQTSIPLYTRVPTLEIIVPSLQPGLANNLILTIFHVTILHTNICGGHGGNF